MRIVLISLLMIFGQTAWAEEADQVPFSNPVDIVNIPF